DLQAPVAAEIAADGAGRGRRRVGRTRERAESLDDAVAGDAHGDEVARHHELDERLVEGLALVLGVVRGEEFALGGELADVDDLVSLALDAREDLAGELTLDAVGLDEDEGLFDGHEVPSYGRLREESTGSDCAGLPALLLDAALDLRSADHGVGVEGA